MDPVTFMDDPAAHDPTRSEPPGSAPSSHDPTRSEPPGSAPSSHDPTRSEPPGSAPSSHNPTRSEPPGSAPSSHDPTEGSHVEDGVVEHPHAKDFAHARTLPEDRTWFKKSVFYEVVVREFFDSNSDGSGDLRGLIEHLDYIKWLGVDCLWLPPFYDSPLRDRGYDIRGFYRVLLEFGTVDDFVALLDQAHRRGIRVITDLVMNHTSDSHSWFQESRRDPDGPYGDFYVWSDTSERYHDARIIFVDAEESNWTFDPVRRQFYWRRFFSHQPDLNYDNPAVQEAMTDVLRFWLGLGIDGFRLDAVQYLFERDGTNCENLPETHAFLKHCRKVIDDEFPGRVLLAEVNQWPADVVEYFDDPNTGGDERHMAFHFPLMPRIFMAVRPESRFPISEILAQTPPFPIWRSGASSCATTMS